MKCLAKESQSISKQLYSFSDILTDSTKIVIFHTAMVKNDCFKSNPTMSWHNTIAGHCSMALGYNQSEPAEENLTGEERITTYRISTRNNVRIYRNWWH